MTLVSHGQINHKTYIFYLYDLQNGVPLRVNPRYKAVTIKEQDLTVQNILLSERIVTYLPPKEKAKLPQHLLSNQQYLDFLSACSLMIPKESLPKGISKKDIKSHRFNSAEALTLLISVSDQGLAEAQNTLGYCYFSGQGVEGDQMKACELFKQSSDQGYAAAQNNLGYLYHQALNAKKNEDVELRNETRALIEQAAEKGHPMALNNLGMFYLEGDSVEVDLTRAILLLKRVADFGFVTAQYNLALCYSEGKGVEVDLKMARDLFQKAAIQGFAEAQDSLGECYQMGFGVPKDLKQAVYWYNESAIQGHAAAQCSLGECYQMGWGVDKDAKLAAYWFQKAVNKEHAEALNKLGYCYQTGFGVPKDLVKAVSYYQQGADQGHLFAQNNLAYCYQNGYGVDKDLVKAFLLFQDAANKGLAQAQYNVGSCYQFGEGVSEDLEKAAIWYKIAVDQGFESAKIALGKIQKLRATKANQEAAQAKLQGPFKVKFDALMTLVIQDMPQYEELKKQWLEVKGKELQVKVFSRIKVLQDSVEKGDMITPQILKELEELSKSFSTALADAKKVIAKAHEKAARKAHQQERRASMRLDQAPVIDEVPRIVEPSVSETRLVKERVAQEAEAREKRRSVTLERRLSRTISRSSLKLDYQQTQEQLAREKEKHELRKSQRLAKPPESIAEPTKTYGRIASFEKTTEEIFEGKREAREYTQLVQNLLREFGTSEDLRRFKKAHDFEKLKKGLGNLVGVDHLKPWEKNGCRICSFRVSDAIPERIAFAWNKKEQKAYQVTFVNYHPK